MDRLVELASRIRKAGLLYSAGGKLYHRYDGRSEESNQMGFGWRNSVLNGAVYPEVVSAPVSEPEPVVMNDIQPTTYIPTTGTPVTQVYQSSIPEDASAYSGLQYGALLTGDTLERVPDISIPYAVEGYGKTVELTPEQREIMQALQNTGYDRAGLESGLLLSPSTQSGVLSDGVVVDSSKGSYLESKLLGESDAEAVRRAVDTLKGADVDTIKAVQTEMFKKGYYNDLAIPQIPIGTKEENMALQRKLKSFGYDLGAYGENKDGVDGKIDRMTKAAWAKYVKEHPNEAMRAYAVSGELDPATEKALAKFYESYSTGDDNTESVNKAITITIPDRNARQYFVDRSGELTDEYYKHLPEGKGADEIKAIQQQFADNGFYDASLSKLSKAEIKAIQSKLIDEGYLSAEKKSDGTYKQVDGKVGPLTKAAWNKYNVTGEWKDNDWEALAVSRKLNSNTDIDWRNNFSAEGIDGCARFVTRKYESVLGHAAVRDGVVGDAWRMPKNIVKAGGTMLFNLYESGFDGVQDVKDLKTRTRAQLAERHIDYSTLKPGDVVGIFYPVSSHHGDVLREGTTYNTHIGIVTGFDKDGMPIVEHNIGGHRHDDRANNLYGVGSQITVAVRPYHTNQETYPFQMGESRYEVDLGENAKPEYAGKLKTFMDSMAGAADVIGKLYNEADIDAVQRIAVGVLQRETGMMQNTESSRTGTAKILPMVRGLYHNLADTPQESRSSDLTKFKLGTLSPDERTFLGIQNASDLEDPAKAGRASLLVLAKNYDYFVRYARQNPQLGLTQQDIEDLTALSYNQGMGRLYSVGSVKIDGERYAAPGKLEAIRQLAESDKPIDDFSATSPGRIASKMPALTGLMKGLYNSGVWGARNRSYMNSARLAMARIREKQ